MNTSTLTDATENLTRAQQEALLLMLKTFYDATNDTPVYRGRSTTEINGPHWCRRVNSRVADALKSRGLACDYGLQQVDLTDRGHEVAMQVMRQRGGLR